MAALQDCNRARRNMEILDQCYGEIVGYSDHVQIETLYEIEIVKRYNRYVKKMRAKQDGE